VQSSPKSQSTVYLLWVPCDADRCFAVQAEASGGGTWPLKIWMELARSPRVVEITILLLCNTLQPLRAIVSTLVKERSRLYRVSNLCPSELRKVCLLDIILGPLIN
jgi:hypothetical protein